jgi:hypothetical protein
LAPGQASACYRNAAKDPAARIEIGEVAVVDLAVEKRQAEPALAGERCSGEPDFSDP